MKRHSNKPAKKAKQEPTGTAKLSISMPQNLQVAVKQNAEADDCTISKYFQRLVKKDLQDRPALAHA